MATDPDLAAVVRRRVRSSLARWRAAGGGEGLVVGVSGGGDSVALLRAIAAEAPGLGLRASVAHLHHGARGEEADRDARFVAELAEALGLPIDLGRWRPGRAGHFEADARHARYAWLAEVARARGASAVAVGHTRDDQAETVLHRVVRGTGVRGLAGIPRRRRLAAGIDLIRPLLTTTRAEARALLDALGQPWREDASNADPDRTRAALRLDVLPALAAINPRVVEALVRLARLSRGTARLAHERAAGLARAIISAAGPAEVVLRRDRLAALPRHARAEVLRLAWRRAGWPERSMSADRWLRMAALVANDRGRHAVGAGIDLRLTPELARLAPAPTASASDSDSADPHRPAGPAESAPLPIPGAAAWGGRRIVAAVDPPPELPCDERIDLDAVDPFLDPSGPYLVVGGPLPGDRFAPLGMAGRSMPLADFLRGRRVPRADRPAVPVVRDRRGVVWVVGHRIADRVRRTDTTARLLGLRAEPDAPLPPSD